MNTQQNNRENRVQNMIKYFFIVMAVLWSCYGLKSYAQSVQEFLVETAQVDNVIENLSGDGTSDSPYTIGSVDDWNTLSLYIAENEQDLTGLYVRLSSNIDFSESTTAIKPLGYDRKTYFNGDLDGYGYTVNIGTVEADAEGFGGLLIQTGSSAVIHDLTIEGTLTSSGYGYVGGLVGKLYGKVSNVTNNVAVTLTPNNVTVYGAGGIAGGAYAGAVITECSNTAKIVGVGQTGGIVGYGVGEEENLLSVSNCTNYGNVQGMRTDIGGILGYAYYYTNLSGCVNYAEVDHTEDTLSTSAAYPYIAGVVGSVYENCNVSQCANHGDVNKAFYTIEEYNQAGGIVGCVRNENCVVSYCYNTGDIYAYQTVGGICGNNYHVDGLIEKCFNVGNITAAYRSAGGITGYAKGTFTDVYNAGDVTAGRYSGGIGGGTSVSYAFVVSNAYNIGGVTATSSGYTERCGNIIGMGDYNSANTVTAAYYLTEKDCGGSYTTYGEGLSYAKLATTNLGDDWTSMDDYSYPILSYFVDNDYAKAYSAAIIPSNEEETYSNITSTVYLGGVESGVTWSTTDEFSSNSSSTNYEDWTDYTGYVYIHGNQADFAPRTSEVEVTLTATSCTSSSSSSSTDGVSAASDDTSSDGVSVSTTLTLASGGFTSGMLEIYSIGSDTSSHTVVAERYYSPNGILLGSSNGTSGSDNCNLEGLYILVRTYGDGSTDAIKVIK